MFAVTTRVEWDAAHRLRNYPGACARVHGHRYVAEVTVLGNKLDALGMLLDFGVVKKIVHEVCYRWDHRLVVHPADNLANLLPGTEVVTLTDGNPTAENMARELYHEIRDALQGQPVTMGCVRLYETPDCWAEYTDDGTNGL